MIIIKNIPVRGVLWVSILQLYPKRYKSISGASRLLEMRRYRLREAQGLQTSILLSGVEAGTGLAYAGQVAVA